MWERQLQEFLGQTMFAKADPAHDAAHISRVVANAKALARSEGADLDVVIPAAWLHDCVIVPKDSPERARASAIAAATAVRYLREIGYPEQYLPAIHHAIHAHSYSAGVEPRTLEAKVVQDADRLDALGAVGIARTLMLGGQMGKPLYDSAEPIPRKRLPDDSTNVLDHFFTKLLRLEQQMQTESGRREARRRTKFMQLYLAQLQRELQHVPGHPSA